MKLLWVDDDIEFLEGAIRSLVEHGHEVSNAGDGHEGIRKALDGDYDLIITNRMMPKMDGLSMIKALRAGGVETPVLVLSALGEVTDRVEGFTAGADDYLVKPFAWPELVSRIEALGRRSRQLTPPKDTPPALPSPRRAVLFALNDNHRLAPTTVEDRSAEIVDVSSAILRNLRGVVDEVLEKLGGSNAYGALFERITHYRAALDPVGDEASRIDDIYANGVRVEGAFAQTLLEIAGQDLPEFSPTVAEGLESCLALHGVLLGSSERGRALIRTARDFNDRAIDLGRLTQETRSLARVVADARDLFSPETGAVLVEAGAEMGVGPHRQRPNEDAFSTTHNLLVSLGQLAMRNPLATGLITEALVHSAPGAAGMGGVTQAIDLSWTFLLANRELLLNLVLSAGPDLFWLQLLIRWIERRMLGIDPSQ